MAMIPQKVINNGLDNQNNWVDRIPRQSTEKGGRINKTHRAIALINVIILDNGAYIVSTIS